MTVQTVPASPLCRRTFLFSAGGQQFRTNATIVTFKSFLGPGVSNSVQIRSTGANQRRRSTVTAQSKEVEQQKQLKRAYPFHEIEPRWQRYWGDNRTFRTPEEIDTSKPKFYVLDMFPYPRFLSLPLSLCSSLVLSSLLHLGSEAQKEIQLAYKHWKFEYTSDVFPSFILFHQKSSKWYKQLII